MIVCLSFRILFTKLFKEDGISRCKVLKNDCDLLPIINKSIS